MGFIAPLIGLWGASKAMKKPSAPDIAAQETPAPAAVTAPSSDNKQETGLDTTGETLKRKARGKKGLMINPSNTSGGGSGGTGLNI